MARHNGGKIKYLNEFLFCRCVAANDLEGMKNIVAEKGVNFASPVLHDPNVISHYIKNTPPETLNEESALWLIENGPSLDRSDKELVQIALSKCRESVVQALLQRGAFCPQFVAINATKRNLPAGQLKVYWSAYSQQQNTSLQDFIEVVKFYKHAGHLKKVLIMLAWQYGNADNSFKILPKELVKHILSFDLGEFEPWFEQAFDLFQKTQYNEQPIYTPEPVTLHLLGFIWTYWNEISLAMKKHVIKVLCDQSYYEETNQHLEVQFKWLVMYIDRLGDQYSFVKDFSPSFLWEFLSDSRDLKWIKHFLATGTLKRAWLTDTSLQARYQPTWRAIYYYNRELIEFYHQQGLLVSTSSDKTLETYLNEPRNEKLAEFVKSLSASKTRQ